jgi:VIT1/CCC1 family predicted Fe2+/Mn2+ transporter
MADWLGALSVCLLVFLSTFPVAVPFIFIGDATLALHVSDAIAILMMLLCGYGFARYAGLPAWTTAVTTVVIGIALVAIAVALGG